MERIWMIITILTISIVIAAIWSFQQIPLFKTTARIQIEPRNQQVVQTHVEVGPVADESDKYYKTMSKVLESRDIAIKASNKLKETYPKEFKQDVDYSGFIIGSIKVKSYSDTRLVDITAINKDPKMAVKIANTLAETFIYNQLDTRMIASTANVRWLESQAEIYKLKLFNAEEALAAYREKKGQVSLEEQQNIIVLKLRNISNKLTEAEAESISAETILAEMNGMLQKKSDPEDVLQIISDPDVSRLYQLLKEKELQISVLKERYKVGYPAMKQAIKELEEVKIQFTHACKHAATKVQSRYDQSLAQKTSLRTELQKRTNDALKLNREAAEYSILKRTAQQSESLYNNIVERINETEIQGETENNNIHIVDKALLPSRPFKPKHAQNILMGAVLGAGLGFGLALLLWITDNRIKKIADIENDIGEKVIAAIPLIKKKLFNENGALKIDKYNNLIIEGFCTMHTELVDQLKDVKKIMITSSYPSEGKTFAATYFGAVIAAEKRQKILLINTDLRRPKLELMFNIDNKQGGMNDVLSKKITWKDAIVKTPLEKLDVLPAGIGIENPTALFKSTGFNELVKELEKHYDLLIFDTPPMLGLGDSKILLSQMDAAIMIVSHNKSKKKPTNYVIEKIKDSNTKLLGVIINKITYRNHACYYYYEQYGYNYSSSVKAGYKDYYKSSYDIVPNLDVNSLKKEESNKSIFFILRPLLFCGSVKSSHYFQFYLFSAKNSTVQTVLFNPTFLDLLCKGLHNSSVTIYIALCSPPKYLKFNRTALIVLTIIILSRFT
jgi:capsular exopolysaccharide synthesis family protein